MGQLLQSVAMSQVRKFLGAVSRIAQSLDDESHLRDRVLLLKPRLAYVAARADEQSRGAKPVHALFEDVSLMIDRTHDPEDFRRLHDYVQGVVAYHRFYGGRD
jgi:CRISPR-associated protein Csm2